MIPSTPNIMARLITTTITASLSIHTTPTNSYYFKYTSYYFQSTSLITHNLPLTLNYLSIVSPSYHITQVKDLVL